MSAYHETTTEFVDGKCLADSLRELGLEVEEHEQAVQLEGYHGDKRQQKAEIVVPRKSVGSASNDIGFVKQANGNYTAIISEYDSSRYNKKWLDKLGAAYATKKVLKEGKNNGFTFLSKKTDSKGNTVVKFTVGR